MQEIISHNPLAVKKSFTYYRVKDLHFRPLTLVRLTRREKHMDSFKIDAILATVVFIAPLAGFFALALS